MVHGLQKYHNCNRMCSAGINIRNHQYFFLYKYQNRSQNNPSPAVKLNRPTKPTPCIEQNSTNRTELTVSSVRNQGPALYSPGCSLDMYLHISSPLAPDCPAQCSSQLWHRRPRCSRIFTRLLRQLQNLGVLPHCFSILSEAMQRCT
jgi:hypothetical protein